MAQPDAGLIAELMNSRLPPLPCKTDFKIGCVGSGFIMSDCHLPSYRKMNWNVTSLCSRSPDRARDLAKIHSIPHVYADVGTMCESGQVEVLDVAVPPDVQPDVILKALESPGRLKGILAQKPLAMDLASARNIIRACASKKVTLAVNQNMRFDHSVRVAKTLLNKNLLGSPVLATIEMRAIPHWMPWSRNLKSLSTYVMSIHHLDTFRYWFGTPERVLASTTRDPRTKFPHLDGVNLYILEYDSGLRASGWDDVWTGPSKEGAASDIYIRWRIEGTNGLARGAIGWPSYPVQTPSTLDFTTRDYGEWTMLRWQESWFPDAFVGTMSQLLCALETGAEPEISGCDNLETLALCEAVFQSSRDHKVISPSLLLM